MLTKRGIWLRDVRQAAGGASNTWIGTDIEDSYFPKETTNDTPYHHQSMTESWPLQWQETFDLVHSRMALPGVDGIGREGGSNESATRHLRCTSRSQGKEGCA